MAYDLTPPEHSHSAAVEEAARWILATPQVERPRPLVPIMRRMFGLSAIEAGEVLVLARKLERQAA